MNCYRKVRVKSSEKCIKELKAIKETDWLPITRLYISDMIFLPKKSARRKFFKKLGKMVEKEGGLSFYITVSDRVDFCSEEDLKNYKKFDITPSFGLESCSKTLLYRMGKILGKNDGQIYSGINNYLKSFKRIVKIGNELDLPITYNYLICLPGTDKSTIREEKYFFFNKRFNGKSLAEKYRITLKLNKYMASIGSYMFENAEKAFGSKFHYKKWWKTFSNDQQLLAAIVDPTEGLSIFDCAKQYREFLIEFAKKQHAIGNPSYSFQNILFFKEESLKRYDLFKKILNPKN